jgi:hypothetical protein
MDYPEEIEHKDYINKYKENFNNNQIVRENGLFLTSEFMNTLKNYLLLFCLLAFLFLFIYAFLGSQGNFKPQFNNNNSIEIKNNFTNNIYINNSIRFYANINMTNNNYYDLNFSYPVNDT